MSFTSQFSTLNQAFGSCNPIGADKIKFDVTTSFQYCINDTSFSTPIIRNTSGDIKKQYYGVVVITPPLKLDDNGMGIRHASVNVSNKKLVGYDYEVYKSSNTSIFSPKDSVLKGQTRYTNINSFTFPIEDITQDYFVLVTPYIETTHTVEKFVPFVPWEQIKIQPNNQLRSNPGERLFKIFYTTRVLKERKKKINSYKKSKQLNQYLKSNPSTLSVDPTIIMQQREQDLTDLKKYQQQFENETHSPVHSFVSQQPQQTKIDHPEDLDKDYEQVLYGFANETKTETVEDRDNREKTKDIFQKLIPKIINTAYDVLGKNVASDDKEEIVSEMSERFDELYEKAQSIKWNFNNPKLVKPLSLLKRLNLSKYLDPPRTAEAEWSQTKSNINTHLNKFYTPENPENPENEEPLNPQIIGSPWVQSSFGLDLTKPPFNQVPSKISCKMNKFLQDQNQEFTMKDSRDAIDELDLILEELEERDPVILSTDECGKGDKNMFQKHLNVENDVNSDDSWNTVTEDTVTEDSSSEEEYIITKN